MVQYTQDSSMDAGRQIPLLITILGLDDASFLKYCNSRGIDSAPFFDIAKGDVMRQTEATTDSYGIIFA